MKLVKAQHRTVDVIFVDQQWAFFKRRKKTTSNISPKWKYKRRVVISVGRICIQYSVVVVLFLSYRDSSMRFFSFVFLTLNLYHILGKVFFIYSLFDALFSVEINEGKIFYEKQRRDLRHYAWYAIPLRNRHFLVSRRNFHFYVARNFIRNARNECFFKFFVCRAAPMPRFQVIAVNRVCELPSLKAK